MDQGEGQIKTYKKQDNHATGKDKLFNLHPKIKNKSINGRIQNILKAIKHQKIDRSTWITILTIDMKPFKISHQKKTIVISDTYPINFFPQECTHG